MAILLTAFAVAMAVRTIWTYPIIAQYGALYSYAGGSDSYYHSRVMSFIILNHTNLIHDPLLRFPVGAINPREPLFDWMNAILGMIFAPAFGGNAVNAGAWFLDLQAPLWAALGVFPVYLIGKEVSNRRMGLIAALIYPFLSANIDSSIFGYANYLSFYTFFILVTVYAYLRTVRAVGSRRWVESYRRPRQFLPALRGFLRTERTAVKWAVFTGVSMGATALAWQGYTYVVVVIALSLLVSMIVERIRRVDSFGLYVAAWIVGLVAFPMELPYYFVQYQSSFSGFETFFLLQALLYFGTLVLLLPFLMLRDTPWVFSIPLMAGLIAAGAAGLDLVNPGLFTTVITGQGYFVKTLVYSTVAEAQAPSIDSLVLGYGVITFFVAFVGLAVFLYLLVRGRFKRVHVVFLVFAVLSIYLPISAAKFFLLGSPIFALLPAEAIRRALDVGSYPELRRTVVSLSDRRSQLAAFRKAFKARHVLVLALVLALLLPNVWVSIDAGIPGNTKAQYGDQVGATLPSWLQLNTSTPSSYYFGAAGSSIDTPNQYDSAGYNWLAQQDTNVPAPQRPAFVSWWDYGFQAIDQGQHPSVADNFQNGIDPAGQFLLAQNESVAIGVLAATLLNGVYGTGALPPALTSVLAQDGLNATRLHGYLVNWSSDYSLVVQNPATYLPVDAATLTTQNAMFMAVSYYIAQALPLSGVARVYNDIQSYTGTSIRYAMTDSRLIPFSYSDTGIYYAPADLTGRLIDSSGSPETYFNVTVLGSNGITYTPATLPAGVSAVSYSINYFAPFYNSMIYRIYFGYNGTQAGLGPGIPGLSLNASIEPGWMLQHFEVVYQTAYYCPQANASYSSSCFAATNRPTAEALAASGSGTADLSASAYFGGGESFLEYYPGQTLLGDLTLPNGAPVAGARVTVDDGWGIPHMTTVTASDGSYSLVLPPGNDTVNITVGTFNPLTQQDSVLVKSLNLTVSNALGLSYAAPNLALTTVLPSATVQGQVYWQTGTNTSFVSGEPLVAGAKVVLWGARNASAITTTTDLSGSFYLPTVAPGSYNVSVLYAGHNYSENPVTATPASPTNASYGLASGQIHGTVTQNGVPVVGARVTVSGGLAPVYNATGPKGNYTIAGFGPGNYTVIASLPGTASRSAGAFAAIASPGTNLTLNLAIVPSAPVTVAVTAGGVPAAGVPVRFLPYPDLSNQSTSPLATLGSDIANGTVVTTAANGLATATLPYGAYSVYALGYVGTSLDAGLAVTNVTAGSRSIVPIALASAVRLGGTVAAGGPTGVGTSTVVLAYAPNGAVALAAAANGTGAFAFYLPAGRTYSVLALRGNLASPVGAYAALASTALSSPTALALAPSPAVAAHFAVGTVLANGSLFPAAAAQVVVSFGVGGAAVPSYANASGGVGVFVPSTLPISAGSYCVVAGAPGFSSASQCNYSPTGLAGLTTFPVGLVPVALTLRVTGLPGGTSAQVNLTATSLSATSRSVLSGASGTFSVTPGTYLVSAFANTGNASVIYRLPTSLPLTVPLGAATAAFAVPLQGLVNVSGTLSLPAGTTATATTVALSSPTFSVTVNGSAYTTGFRVAPGPYSVYANVTAGGTLYAGLATVTVPSTGTIVPTLVVKSAASTIDGSLLRPSGSVLATNTTIALIAPGGVTVHATVTNGTFAVVLPLGVTYGTNGTAATTVAGPNGTYSAVWSTAAGTACTPTSGNPVCTVPLVPATSRVYVNGTLIAPGNGGPVAGTVRFVGPYPYTNLTVVTASAGRFSAVLLPGSYSVYASGGGVSDLLANFTTVVALASASAPLVLPLAPTWLDTISVAPPNGSAATLSGVNLTVYDAFGRSTVFPLVPFGTSVPIALPVGVYTVQASAVGAPYGAAAYANGTSPVTIVTGNQGTVVALAYQFTQRAIVTLVGQTSVTAPSGTNVTFAFNVRNGGNEPISVHPVGAPAYWPFAFSLGNVTLPVGGGVIGGTATISIPRGTLVDHPTVAIEIATGAGTIVGVVSPLPVVNVVGYYGIAVGSPGASYPAEIGHSLAQVPFYLANTGNQGETVSVSVVDAYRVEGLGWALSFARVNSSATGPTAFLAAQTNVTWLVALNASGPVFVPPGTVTVSVTVLNASGAVQSTATLPVPFGVVGTSSPSGGPPLTVTGPGLGTPSPTPVWLVPLLAFVPALALVGLVLLYRWNRSRRWKR